MNPEIFKSSLDKITEKIGAETAAIIADDLGILTTAQESALQDKQKLEDKIADLEQLKTQLVASNANLLRQIPVSDNTTVPRKDEEQKTAISLNPMDAFDEYGRLKK